MRSIVQRKVGRRRRGKIVRGRGEGYHPSDAKSNSRPTLLAVPTFPEWIEPMAATLTQERFTGPEWIFERKYDGIRALAFKHGGEVRLLSRPLARRIRKNAREKKQ